LNTIFILCAISSQFPDMFYTASVLIQEGYDVTIVFGTDAEELDNAKLKCSNAGLNQITYTYRNKVQSPGQSTFGVIKNRVKSAIRSLYQRTFIPLRNVLKSAFLKVEYLRKRIWNIRNESLKKIRTERFAKKPFWIITYIVLYLLFEILVLFAYLYLFFRRVLSKTILSYKILVNETLHYLIAYKRVQTEKKIAVSFLNRHSPEMIIIPYEAIGYFYDVLLGVARKKQIPILTLPFCYVSTEDTLKWFCSIPNGAESYGVNTLFRKFIKKHYKDWVHCYADQEFFRLTPYYVWARILNGVAKPKPWIDNYGFANKVIVESDQAKKFLIDNGVPESSLRVCVSPSYEFMGMIISDKETYRQDLLTSLGFYPDSKKKLILISLPDVFDLTRYKKCEFQHHRELVDFMMTPLQDQEDADIVISLHPRLDKNSVEYLEIPGRIRISEKTLIELLPCCDAFITITSAAIKYAIPCKIPIIEYDIIGFESNHYKSASVIRVDKKEDYIREVKNMLISEADYSDIDTDEWGSLNQPSKISFLDVVKSFIKDYYA